MPKNKKTKTKTAMKRLNHRIRKDQDKFIKKMSKAIGFTEGEALREIIDAYINGNK